jgi:hypothetical protein
MGNKAQIMEFGNTNGATPKMGTTGDEHCLARMSLGRVLEGKGLTAVAGPGVGKAFFALASVWTACGGPAPFGVALLRREGAFTKRKNKLRAF